MPRVNIGISPQQKAIRNDCRGLYGGMMSVSDVGELLGLKWDSTNKWLEGLTAYNINGRRKYRTIDIADRLWGDRIENN